MSIQIKTSDDSKMESKSYFKSNGKWPKWTKFLDYFSRVWLVAILSYLVAFLWLLVEFAQGKNSIVPAFHFLIGICLLIPWFGISRELFHIFSAIAENGTPFTRDVVKSLYRTSFFLLALPIVQIVVQMLIGVLMHGHIPLFNISLGYGGMPDLNDLFYSEVDQPAITIGIASFLVSGVVAILAKAFSYGCELQDEADHTV